MPIFHDPQESPPRRPASRQVCSAGSEGAETPKLAFQAPLLDEWSLSEATELNMSREECPESPNELRKPNLLDRVDLIERIKRTKSPPWLQRQDVGDWQSFGQMRQEQLSSQGMGHADGMLQDDRHLHRESQPISRDRPKKPLLPAGELYPSRTTTPEPLREIAAVGLAIERPRSALHSGDFREEKAEHHEQDSASSDFLATSPVAPWHRSFPAAAYTSRRDASSHAALQSLVESRAVSRARATSQTSLNSFAFLPPTSPLVQQANNTDSDVSRPGSRQGSKSPERNNRRHTYSPASFHGYQTTKMGQSASGTPAARHLRHGGTIPYQAHQPRRLSTFNQFQPQSNPSSPFLSSRRPSFSSEASPLQHAPMVGSYEESILRGRMSTTPSRPLDFVAKIGVLGKGQCKSSLKCPAHVTIPFPAVFYSYNTGNGRISDNEPSPYVGLIDLEHSLPAPADNDAPNKRTRRHAMPESAHDDLDSRLHFREEDSMQGSKDDVRRKEKRKRRSASPKVPPGGCYRVPPQGQLQIVLKNPNKTAVKLFLVPYDCSDMEPGQKTFIRQRSYSAGPIIDMPTSSRKNLNTDRPEAAISNSDDPNDRPTLRYLIHLHICCPSKGCYYLYKSIRVVFANRVPDGKEKLRNEIQLPDPKYSVYKPTIDSISSQNLSSAGVHLTAKKASRRRSAGWPLSQSQQIYDRTDGLQQRLPPPPPAVQFCPRSTSVSSALNPPMSDLQPIPFSLTRLAAIESRPVSRDHMDTDSKSPFRTPLTSPKSAFGSPYGHADGTFEKLNRGDVGYGGNAFSPVSSPTTPLSAGLLSQRLRGLDAQRDEDRE